jgi:hypothetical protein
MNLFFYFFIVQWWKATEAYRSSKAIVWINLLRNPLSGSHLLYEHEGVFRKKGTDGL